MDKILVLKYPIRGSRIASKEEIAITSEAVKKVFGEDWKLLVIPEDYHLRMYNGGGV